MFAVLSQYLRSKNLINLLRGYALSDSFYIMDSRQQMTASRQKYAAYGTDSGDECQHVLLPRFGHVCCPINNDVTFAALCTCAV
ncbi:hypothetical protein GC090_09815 [Pantoea sp. JZ29]|nr:hypothetical protein GC090_09815 [Pantoea sp. JZ29]